MEKLVSIIVTIKNDELYLEKCLKSIVNQTHKNIEIILVVSESFDKSARICKEWQYRDNRVKVVNNIKGNLSSARNDGLYIAKGEYIYFLNARDYLDINFVKKMVEKQQETNADLIFCKYKSSDDSKEKQENGRSLLNFIANKKIEKFFFGSRINCSLGRCLFTRNSIRNVVFNSQINEDIDLLFMLEVILENNIKMALVNEVLSFLSSKDLGISPNLINKFNSQKEQIKLLEDYVQKDIAKALKFKCYLDYFKVEQINHNSELLSYNSKENYKCYKKFEKLCFLRLVKINFLFKKINK